MKGMHDELQNSSKHVLFVVEIFLGSLVSFHENLETYVIQGDQTLCVWPHVICVGT